MAYIHFLNGVSFEIRVDDVDQAVRLIETDPKFTDFKTKMAALSLELKIVSNDDDSSAAIMLGVKIAPSYQSIYQGRTIVGDPSKFPLPDQFHKLMLELKALIEAHAPIAYEDIGIVLSQYD